MPRNTHHLGSIRKLRKKHWKNLFLYDFLILSFWNKVSKVVSASSNSIRRKMFITIMFLDYDHTTRTLHCKFYLLLIINIFGVMFSKLWGFKHKFEFFLSVLLNVSNTFQLYTTKLDWRRTKCHCDFHKNSLYCVFILLPRYFYFRYLYFMHLTFETIKYFN